MRMNDKIIIIAMPRIKSILKVEWVSSIFHLKYLQKKCHKRLH